MTKERLLVLAANMMDCLDVSVDRDGDALYDILSNECGMTDNEIDELSKT